MPNGDVVTGGSFTAAGGASANYIARWDGSNWSPMGTGMDAPVLALAVMPNGDVVAAGNFATAGGSERQSDRPLGWRGVVRDRVGHGRQLPCRQCVGRDA